MKENREQYAVGLELIYDLRRKLWRLLAWMEYPAKKARSKLEEMDGKEGHGRRKDSGPPAPHERRKRR